MNLLIMIKSVFLLISTLFFANPNTQSSVQHEIIINSRQMMLIAPESVNYQWYYNGMELKGETQRNLTPVRSGEYTVYLTDAKGGVSHHQINIAVEGNTIRRIYLIGDSTVSLYSPARYPRMGWGQVFQSFFDSSAVQVEDLAVSGRSSKSFYDEGHWAPISDALHAGDYVFIQFGHNDEKTDKARHTDPFTSFKKYLTIYIDGARAKGACPVLITPVNRNKWKGGEIKDTHGDYVKAIRQLAAEKNVPLIDLFNSSKNLFDSLGQEYTTQHIFMNLPAGKYPNYPEGHSDNTHFQEYGARRIAQLVYDGIRTSKWEVLRSLTQKSSSDKK